MNKKLNKAIKATRITLSRADAAMETATLSDRNRYDRARRAYEKAAQKEQYIRECISTGKVF